ncbi:MAG: META domain-containing protein [Gemmobacter sp.]
MTLLFRTAVVCALLAGAAGAEAERPVSGEAVILERVALSPDAVLIVELVGIDGAVAAETRIRTDGRQVPLPFVVTGTDGRAYSLRSAIFEAGETRFLSETVAVPAGTGALNIGPVLLRRHVAMGVSTRFLCGETVADVGFVGEEARLRVGGEVFRLAPVPAASGARFEADDGSDTWIWSKGPEIAVTVRGEALADCRPVVPPRLLPFRATGNEPGWALELSNTRLLYVGSYGADRIETALPEAEPTPTGIVFDLPVEGQVFLDEALCRDTMTGIPYPVTVRIERGGEVLNGCGGNPAELLIGPEWTITAVNGTAVPADAEATILFGTDGRVAGRAACNRYSGTFSIGGESMRFGPVAATRMACPEPLMSLERDIFAAFERIDGFDLGDDGRLILTGAGEMRIEARRGG